jgi:hypothetical protein
VLEEGARIRLVIDDEDSLPLKILGRIEKCRSPPRIGSDFQVRSRRRLSGSGRGGEVDRKGRSHPDGRFDGDPVSHELTERPRDRESEPRSSEAAGCASVRLLEGLEDRLEAVRRDAHPGVTHQNPLRDAPSGSPLDSDDHLAALGELEGISHEVDDDLTKLSRVSEEGCEVLREVSEEEDRLTGHLTFELGQGLANEL